MALKPPETFLVDTVTPAHTVIRAATQAFFDGNEIVRLIDTCGLVINLRYSPRLIGARQPRPRSQFKMLSLPGYMLSYAATMVRQGKATFRPARPLSC